MHEVCYVGFHMQRGYIIHCELTCRTLSFLLSYARICTIWNYNWVQYMRNYLPENGWRERERERERQIGRENDRLHMGRKDVRLVVFCVQQRKLSLPFEGEKIYKLRKCVRDSDRYLYVYRNASNERSITYLSLI